MTTPTYANGELIPGTVYRVERQLGAAGFGAVYQVEDTKAGRKYCLKTLGPVTGDIALFRERLAAEAKALARLAHPNVVQVLSAGLTGDPEHIPYFVMELLEGRTLRETLDRQGNKKLDAAHALAIATQILDALDHAHGRGMVHRDVKPENIFLHRSAGTGPTQAKLLDFGVVTFLRESSGMERGSGLSPRYAAPELLEGDEATPASDLYSMGLVLYEMLAGHGPFDGGDLSDVARARLERGPAPLDADLPLVLQDLVLSALERDPHLRPADAFSFAETLRTLTARSMRVPQRNLLSSDPPPIASPIISDLPDGLVEADWSPPPTPRTAEVQKLLSEAQKKRDSQPAAEDVFGRDPDVRTGPFAPKASLRPSTFERASSRETLVGVALGLALLLVTLFVVMLK